MTADAPNITADPADALLARQTPAARALLQQLRALVKASMPQAVEQVHLGWEVVAYYAGGGMRSMVIALAPRPTYVNLQFGDGTVLPDPERKLEGTGKLMRHVKIRSAEDARDPAVRALLTAAAARKGLGSAPGPA